MCRLLRSQQSDNQKLVSFTFGWWIIRLIGPDSIFYPAWSDQYLLSDAN